LKVKQETIRNLAKQYIKSRKAGLSINKESNLRSIQPYSVVTSTREGSGERISLESLPKIRRARTPTSLPVKNDSPHTTIVKRTELEGERTLTKMSEKNPVYTVSSQSGNPVGKREDDFFGRKKNRGSQIINIKNGEEEDIVKSLLYDNFRKSMRYRLLHRERFLNASAIVTQKEEEFRIKAKEEYLEREQRWLEKKKSLLLELKNSKVKCLFCL